jgi:NTE family protein
VFPPQRIGRNYYGDGALRQLSPISPAIHLGAEKVLIVSSAGHKKTYDKPYRRIHSPSFGQIIGHLLNSAFIDTLESDIELLEQLNELVELLPSDQRSEKTRDMQAIDIHVVSPSIDIDTLAEDYFKQMPRSIRTLLRVTGSNRNEGGVNIASYLLFTEGYCRALLDLGYRDAMAQKDTLLAFLEQ